MNYLARPRCCRFFVSPRREEGSYPRRCNRRATPERRKSGATRRASMLWAVWPRCSLLTGCCGHARCSRLATRPKAFSRGTAAYFNRLLK